MIHFISGWEEKYCSFFCRIYLKNRRVALHSKVPYKVVRDIGTTNLLVFRLLIP